MFPTSQNQMLLNTKFEEIKDSKTHKQEAISLKN